MSPQNEQWRRQVYSVCIMQFSCFTKYNRMQSKHKQTNCKHNRRKFYGLDKIKELFKKTILNSSLNSHVFWDTLYITYKVVIYVCLFLWKSDHKSETPLTYLPQMFIGEVGITTRMFLIWFININFKLICLTFSWKT